jgi:hypothetical protein
MQSFAPRFTRAPDFRLPFATAAESLNAAKGERRTGAPSSKSIIAQLVASTFISNMDAQDVQDVANAFGLSENVGIAAPFVFDIEANYRKIAAALARRVRTVSLEHADDPGVHRRFL